LHNQKITDIFLFNHQAIKVDFPLDAITVDDKENREAHFHSQQGFYQNGSPFSVC